MKGVLAVFGGLWLWLMGSVASATTYTPLITETTFDGVRADAVSAATGIVSICLIIAGLGIIVRMFMR